MSARLEDGDPQENLAVAQRIMTAVSGYEHPALAVQMLLFTAVYINSVHSVGFDIFRGIRDSESYLAALQARARAQGRDVGG